MALDFSSLSPANQKAAIDSGLVKVGDTSTKKFNTTGAAIEGARQLNSAAGGGDISSGVISGAGTGAQLGGPWGAAIGGVVGGLAGALSSRSKRKAANRKIDAETEQAKGVIEANRGNNEVSILKGLAGNLSQTLLR